jgi:hypothetical protein
VKYDLERKTRPGSGEEDAAARRAAAKGPERARTTATPTRIIIVSLDLKAKIVVISIVNK